MSGSDLPGIEVDPVALQSVSDLASGTRTLAIYSERWEAAPLGATCLYLHGVSDPGNVGTALRSAAAFGAACVALGAGSATRSVPRLYARAWARSLRCRSHTGRRTSCPA